MVGGLAHEGRNGIELGTQVATRLLLVRGNLGVARLTEEAQRLVAAALDYWYRVVQLLPRLFTELAQSCLSLLDLPPKLGRDVGALRRTIRLKAATTAPPIPPPSNGTPAASQNRWTPGVMSSA